MFGLGATEIMIILLVALLVLGPKGIPEVARWLGKGLREMRRMSFEVQRELARVDLEEDVKRQLRDLDVGNAAAKPEPAAQPATPPQAEASQSDGGTDSTTPEEPPPIEIHLDGGHTAMAPEPDAPAGDEPEDDLTPPSDEARTESGPVRG